MTKIHSEGPTVVILNAVKDLDVRFTRFFAFAQNDKDSLSNDAYVILNAVKDPDVRFTGFFAFAQNDEDSLRMTDCCHPERSEGSRC
ncbi:MAG: hypothetical protein PHR46_04420 [Candidatus Absconditabacteria bacterium]|nr:hypothetical protein [Candidatus Absconditabacteria bacterium]